MTTTLPNFLNLIKADEEGKVQFIPFVQVARASVGNPELFGLFISAVEAEKVEFSGEGGKWKKHTHDFNGATVEGFINPNPRIVIVKQGLLGMFSRETDKFIGNFNKDVYSKTIHELRTRYLILLMDDKGQPMHEKPLQLTAKGAFGGSFGEVLKGFKTNFCKTIEQKRTRNFWTKVIFQPRIEPKEIKMQKSSVWVASVTGCVFPSLDNLEKMYLTEEATRKMIDELIEEYKDFGQFTNKKMGREGEETAPLTSSNGLALVDRIKRDMLGGSNEEYTESVPY